MSWISPVIQVSCGSSNTGLASTMKFAFVAPDGTVNATLRDLTHTSANLIEVGLGVYTWEYLTMPDAFVGSVYFYLGTIGVSPATWPGGVTQFLASVGFSLADEVLAKTGASGGIAGQTSINTLQTSVNNIASGASVVNANNASGAAIPTLAQIWQDVTSAHFTVANSIGKSLFTGLAPGDVTGGLVKNNAAFTPAAFVVAGSTSFNNTGQTTPPPSQPSLSGQ